MKYAVINPLDNSVFSIEDVMSPADIDIEFKAPYLVQANDDTAVGAIYDPHTATFDNPDPPPPEGGADATRGRSGKSRHHLSDD